MKKGEIWIVDLPEGKGHEQKGERPAIVLGKASGLAIVVPLTSNLGRAKFSFTFLVEQTPENDLSADSIALVFQIVSLDETRFKHKTGEITKEQQNTIDQLISAMLKLSNPTKQKQE